jgi:hypothetical protein
VNKRRVQAFFIPARRKKQRQKHLPSWYARRTARLHHPFSLASVEWLLMRQQCTILSAVDFPFRFVFGPLVALHVHSFFSLNTDPDL